MKLLVATRRTQGSDQADFDDGCVEGELVTLGPDCEADPSAPRCGCSRAFTGLNTGAETTTSRVRVQRDGALVGTMSPSNGPPDAVSDTVTLAWRARDHAADCASPVR